MGLFKQAWLQNREEEEQYFLFLSMCNCVGIRTYLKMQSFFSSPSEFYKSDEKKWENAHIFTKKQLERFEKAKELIDLDRSIDYMRKNDIRFYIYEDTDYPQKLKEIQDPPPFLFLKGKLPKVSVPLVSIIGARECSSYGAHVAARLGEELARRGIGVVSGMARGIDSISQEATLRAGGYSLAVLGNGVDIIYPRESKSLYERLCQNGGVLSEFAPQTEAQKPYFALRNRLVSGLSDVVCVVEAKEKSGTLITVDHALSQGKEVYAVPGRISDITNYGTNCLIREGAGIVCSVSSFADEVCINYAKENRFEGANDCEETSWKMPPFSKIEIKVIENLEENSITIDQLSAKTHILSYELIEICMGLSGREIMESMGAGRFMPTKKGIELRNRIKSGNFGF